MAFDLSTAKPVSFDLATATPVEGEPMPAETAQQAGDRYRNVFGGGARAKGKQLSSGAQGLISALQGPTFGFADELAGAGAAFAGLTRGDLDVTGNYRDARDMARGATQAAAEQNPILATATQVAASVPATAFSTVPKAVSAPVTMTSRMIGAAKPAAAVGAATGAGQSEADSAQGLARDIGLGAASSAVLAGMTQPVLMGMGSAGWSGISLLNKNLTNNYAKQKVAEALIRDARGAAAQASPTGGVTQAAARIGKLGDDAMVVDAAGQNTRALLDVLATAPGRTKDAAERAIRERMAGRGARIGAAAERSLGTQGRAYVESIDAFDQARRTAAAPLYQQLDNAAVQVDDDLAAFLSRSSDFHKEAETMARLNGQAVTDLAALKRGDAVPLSTLDTLKNTLWDAADSLKARGETKKARALDELRTSLVAKLDDIGPKDQAGKSIYRAARDAWGGPSSSIRAAEMGRTILREDAGSIAQLTGGMSAAEREAFRIGATQAVKEKAGTQSGQTQLLKMWANPGVREKLQAVFGREFRQFASAIAAEERKKGLESVGRGSQTAARQFGADDLDVSAVMDAGQAAAGALRGNPGGTWQWMIDQSRRIQTPEPVRDEMGRILMQRGPLARNVLEDLAQYAEEVGAKRARDARTAGAFLGLQAPGFVIPQ